MSPSRSPSRPPAPRATAARRGVPAARRRGPGVGAVLALALVGLAGSCRESAAGGPGRLDLAREFRPAPVASGPWRALASGGPPLVLEPDPDGGAWITMRLGRSGFRGTPYDGVVRTRVPLPPVGTREDGEPRTRLVVRGEAWTEVPFTEEVVDAPGRSYVLVGRNLFAKVPPGFKPSEGGWRLSVYVDRGELVDGRWRVTLPRYAGDGLPLLPGEEHTRVCDVPADSALRFATVAFHTIEDAASHPAAATFEVLLDGERLYRHEQSVSARPRAEVHEVLLPADGVAQARLTLRVDGPAALTAILSPKVGPAEPERDERPDVLLFLADTFRADNLDAYGGGGLAPNLDRLAEESLVFERSWTPTPWTLPAQSSMLSGLYPHEHGVIEPHMRLSDEVQTLAERLREAGYRTGAVTGGGYISPAFGLDQGFEWFDSSWTRWDVEATVEGVLDFLAVDDGRPSFVFVQTYRAHSPYVSEAGPDGEFAADGAWLDANARFLSAASEWTNGEPMSDELAASVDRFQELYGHAVTALDRGFAVLRRELEARGRWDDTWLVFTSDHGEAFGEHEYYGHGTGLWEELTRIPLMVRGPSLAPGSVTHSATLVDLPMTVARIAGVAPDPDWRGRSLLELDVDRPALLFECNLDGDDHIAGAVEGRWKVQLPDVAARLHAGELLCAHDLTRDPAERTEGTADLPPGAAQRLGRELLEHRHARHAPARARLGEETQAAMDALGYAGAGPREPSPEPSLPSE